MAKITGRHNIQCFDMTLDAGTDTKGPCVILSLRVVDGPFAGQDYTKYASLNGGALEYTMKSLRALGWQGENISKALQEGLGSTKAVGSFYEKAGQDGKTRTELMIYPIGASAAKNPVEDINRFDALFADAAKLVPAVSVTEANKAVALPTAPTNNGATGNPNQDLF